MPTRFLATFPARRVRPRRIPQRLAADCAMMRGLWPEDSIVAGTATERPAVTLSVIRTCLTLRIGVWIVLDGHALPPMVK